jgi:Uma2 family endonuclease
MGTNSNHTSLKEPEPAWEVARLFPAQGSWSEEDYLDLDGNYLVEYSQGFIDVLPMPTPSHQDLVLALYGFLLGFSAIPKLGRLYVAPLRVRIGPREFREPDILFVLREHAHLIGRRFCKGADLVMEVVSPAPSDRRRDLKDKRRDYAKAGISEYWIVDPRDERIIVLRLDGKNYTVHGEFSRGEKASSHLLKGFTVDVSAAFDSQYPEGVKSARAKRRPKA